MRQPTIAIAFALTITAGVILAHAGGATLPESYPGVMAVASAVLAATPPGEIPTVPAPILSVEQSADHKTVRLGINPPKRTGLVFVEVIDPATGRCLRTLYAGSLTQPRTLDITKASGLAPGKYRLRYRQGIDLVLKGKAEPAAELKQRWLNPVDVVVLDRAVYVLDAGLSGLEDPAHHSVEREWKPIKGAAVTGKFVFIQAPNLYLRANNGTQLSVILPDLSPEDQKLAADLDAQRIKFNEANPSRIYKFNRDGQPDLSFGNHGQVLSPVNGSTLHSLAVDDDGLIYMASGGHSAQVVPATGSAGGKPLRQIGGWDGDPVGPKCTTWVNSLALGRDNRIYLPSYYGNMKVYDRTKSGFDGIIARVDLPNSVGTERAITADREGRVYEIGNDQRLRKFMDDGKTIKAGQLSDPADKLAFPTGPSSSGELVWLACHGPGFGPYWDSGGGGEVILYWDDIDAKQFRLVARFGVPGTAADQLEFLNPACAVVSPDSRELWVAEDGMENTEGPPGNARVRRFIIKDSRTEEIELNLPAWP